MFSKSIPQKGGIIMAIEDKGNALLLKLMGEEAKAIADTIRFGSIKYDEYSETKKTKENLGFEGKTNNHISLYQMEGVTADQAKALLESQNIRYHDVITNKEGLLLVSVKKSEENKLYDLQSRFNQNQIDKQDIYDRYQQRQRDGVNNEEEKRKYNEANEQNHRETNRQDNNNNTNPDARKTERDAKSLYDEEKRYAEKLSDLSKQKRETTLNINAKVTGSGRDIPENRDFFNQRNTNSSILSQNLKSNDLTAVKFSLSDKGQQDSLTINRLELKKKHDFQAANKMADATGRLATAPVTEGFEDSDVGQGRRETKGFDAFTKVVAYAGSTKTLQSISFGKLEKHNKQNDFNYASDFIKSRGMIGLNFSSIKDGRETIEKFSSVLSECGLASKRKGVWDYTKFNRMYNKAKKTNDWGDIMRALKLNSPELAKQTADQMKKLVDESKKTQTQKKDKIKSKKAFAGMSARKLLQDSTFLKGFEDTRRVASALKSSIKAARMVAIYAQKGLYAIAKRIAKVTPFKDSFMKFDNKLNAFNTKKNYYKSNPKALSDKLQDKLYGKEKMDAKRKEKADKKKKKQDKKKKRKENFKNKTYGKLAAALSKTKIGRGVLKVVKPVPTVLKYLNPLNLLAKVFSAINSLKRYLFMIGGGALLILVAIAFVFNTVGSVVGAVTAFFSFDGLFEEKERTIKDSVAYQTYDDLKKMETSWAKQLANGASIPSFDQAKFGPNYVSGAEYAQYLSQNSPFNVTFDATNKGFVISNPFGSYSINSEATKTITNIDGGAEVLFQNPNSSTVRTSNIKEIISMANVFFGMEEDLEDLNADDDEMTTNASDVKASGMDVYAVEKTYTKSSLDTYKKYCHELFDISHQEIINLMPVILPTNLNYGIADDVLASDELTLCPSTKYDGYGCAEASIFCFDTSGNTLVRDTAGYYHDVDSKVYTKPAELCYNTASLTDTMASHTDCYKISFATTELIGENYVYGQYYNIEKGTGDQYQRNESYTEDTHGDNYKSNFRNAIENMCNKAGYRTFDYSDINFVSEENGVLKIQIDEWKKVDDYNIIIDNPDPKTNSYYYNVEHHQKYGSYVYIAHECAENHTGYYCGGHLKGNNVGIIYSMTEDQLNGEITEKVANGAYVHQDVKKVTIVNPNYQKTMKDIFDADSAIIHPAEPDEWEGWTRDNIEIVQVKVIQDWDDLYGIAIGTSLGGTDLSSKEERDIMATVMAAYPNLSDRRKEVLKKALTYVGNMGYSQEHHACPIDGPCIYNPDQNCYLSDCSGFVSYIWQNELGGLYTTSTFLNTFNPPHINELWPEPKPGDIFLHYEGTMGDGVDDHALIYVGNIEYNGVKEQYFIDCSTELYDDPVGNVFFRPRGYYGECYVIQPCD